MVCAFALTSLLIKPKFRSEYWLTKLKAHHATLKLNLDWEPSWLCQASGAPVSDAP